MPTARKFEIKIRPILKSDLSEIHTIHTACLQTSLVNHYSREQLETWMAGRTPKGYWRSFQEGSPYLIALSDAQVIGYANWKDDELMSLFVHPDAQKSGVGTKLFLTCDGEARLHHVKATLSAVEFYQRFGFEVVKEKFDIKRGVRLPYILMRRPEA